MLCLTRRLLICLTCAFPYAAHAVEPCKTGLVGITLIAGSYNPPYTIEPDIQSINPGGKFPDNLIELGWSNLRKAERPLRLICRYAGGKKDELLLPTTTDKCFLRPGLTATCD
ncbi:hypothetical protein SAMN05444581_12317 [Methylocapsa palsarum]|uniref:Uncharacterized protein n=1 Tax=Methylocapsa palsarum TaxID=1612308 RepID=A0A1I4CK49_9HYPH|nr:hypothetical protein SAMN05444581_12317 [Methylocapsa palsarum]